jgi:transcriptional regulator of arginine metabolism
MGMGSFKFQNIMKDSVVNIKLAQNIVVIKCFSGMAQAACAAIDVLNKPEIVGTIAGDDTIFIAAEDNKKAADLMAEFNNILI